MVSFVDWVSVAFGMAEPGRLSGAAVPVAVAVPVIVIVIVFAAAELARRCSGECDRRSAKVACASPVAALGVGEVGEPGRGRRWRLVFRRDWPAAVDGIVHLSHFWSH